MKKLFLTSIYLNGIESLLEKPLNKIRMAYIPTAADPYKNKWFIEEDYQRLKKMGINYFVVDIKNKTESQLLKELSGIDVLFIAGGNVFYLLEKTRKSRFDKAVQKLVNQGVIYAGASAGAVLVCPTIEPMKYLDDPSKASNLKSFTGLGLVDFVILPHYGNKKYAEEYEKTIKEFSNKNYEFLKLTDNQAVVVKGNKYNIIKTN